jgi:hypothetical protein
LTIDGNLEVTIFFLEVAAGESGDDFVHAVAHGDLLGAIAIDQRTAGLGVIEVDGHEDKTIDRRSRLIRQIALHPEDIRYSRRDDDRRKQQSSNGCDYNVFPHDHHHLLLNLYRSRYRI